MIEQEEKSIVEAYSRGEIRRADMLERLGLESSVAETFRLLAKYELTPPSYPNSNSPQALTLLRHALSEPRHGQ